MYFLILFLFLSKAYSYTPGFQTLPIKKHISVISYYLKPIGKNNQKNFLVMECASKHKDSQAICKKFSSTSFTLTNLESLAAGLEEWDSYYLGLDIGVFVGFMFKKVRSWVWQNPVGRVVGVLALAGEISDFFVQKKQGIVYAVISTIDQTQIGLNDLEGGGVPQPKVLQRKLSKGTGLSRQVVSPKDFWIPLEGFNKDLIQGLLNIVGNL